MAKLEALEVALQAVEALQPLVAAIARHDRNLASQLRESGSSVPLNLAEGAGRQGGDRLHHYRIAAGSAREVRTTLRVAVASGGSTACWRCCGASRTHVANAGPARAARRARALAGTATAQGR
jgi:four helix bundle protein